MALPCILSAALTTWWLTHYEFATPGCEAGNNGTWLMLESAPQPDAFLRILPAHGGQSRDEGKYPCGAPELVVEICITSTEIDFGRKLALYQRAGVREYLTIVELPRPRLIRRYLDAGGSYPSLSPDADGVYRSRVFPGLWLDPQMLWKGDGEGMRRTLDEGLASPEHQAFLPTLG